MGLGASLWRCPAAHFLPVCRVKEGTKEGTKEGSNNVKEGIKEGSNNIKEGLNGLGYRLVLAAMVLAAAI